MAWAWSAPSSPAPAAHRCAASGLDRASSPRRTASMSNQRSPPRPDHALTSIGENMETHRGQGPPLTSPTPCEGAAGGDHGGAGEGPDAALATLAAQPPACE